MTNHPRYTTDEMADVWSDKTRFENMLKVEVAAAKSMADHGIIPPDAADAIVNGAGFDMKRLREIEGETRHETIAFLTAVKENIGDAARYLHYGMTSSDVLDTALSLQLQQSTVLIRKALITLLTALYSQIQKHRTTPCIGRSHGIHAEPTTFGLKLAGHYAAFARNLARLDVAAKEVCVCQLSGAVGTFPILPPEIEEGVADALGLAVEPVSTQVIPRDRHAAYFSALALIAGSIENLATEIRHLQRTEVLEVEEAFRKGQKGSSAMPHKKNPILSENLTGLARIVRSTVVPALENQTLWHERDMSHSSVERFIAPQAMATLEFALLRLAGVVDNLVVHSDRMQSNLDALHGLVFSQRVLLALSEGGASREDAYEIVQRNAMKVWNEEGVFYELLAADPDVMAIISQEDLKDIFDLENALKNIPQVIDRCFKVYPVTEVS